MAAMARWNVFTIGLLASVTVTITEMTMPWDANSFASKHNHKLHGKAARGASEAANKALANGKSDASAIRIGNAVGDKVGGFEAGGKMERPTMGVGSNTYGKGGIVMSKSYAKGGDMEACSYAEGGPVLGRVRDFLKEPVEFRDRGEGKRQSQDVVGDTADADQKYGKTGPGAGKGMHAPPAEKGKPMKTVLPRK